MRRGRCKRGSNYDIEKKWPFSPSLHHPFRYHQREERASVSASSDQADHRSPGLSHWWRPRWHVSHRIVRPSRTRSHDHRRLHQVYGEDMQGSLRSFDKVGMETNVEFRNLIPRIYCFWKEIFAIYHLDQYKRFWKLNLKNKWTEMLTIFFICQANA